MNALLAFRRAASVLVLLAVAAFAASQRDGTVFVAAGTLALAAALLVDGAGRFAVPTWFVRLGVLAAIGWGALRFAERPSAEEAPRVVGGVVLGVLLLKLWERKSPEDWRQVMALSIVLVVASALASADFAVGLLVVAYGGATVVATMLYQLHAGQERALAEARAAVASAAAPPTPAQGPRAARDLRRLAVAGIAIGAALSALVFVAFPRDAATGPGAGGARVSGFRPEVDLWGAGRTSLSSRVAMTVQLLDPRDSPGQLVRPLRVRGAVLDRYSPESAQWRGSQARRSVRTFSSGARGYEWFAPEASEERSNVWTQVVELRSFTADHVFSAWLPLALATDSPRDFARDPRTGVLLDGGTAMSGRLRGYRIRMQAYPSPRITQALTGALPPRDASFPVPEVRAIAERIVAAHPMAEIPTAEQAAQDEEQRWVRSRRLAALFRDHLAGEAFRYTTDLSGFRRASGEDPIALFLERYRFGQCEHFASALAALCLSMGVEARVVTGYMSSEYDDVAERYVVRESGAHAWTEVRTGAWQWSTLDPSPMDDLLEAQRANRTWMDSLRWALDPVEFAWNSRFASFDGRAQAELGERVAGGTRGAGEWIGSRAGALVDELGRRLGPGPGGRAWLAAAVAAAAAGVAAVAFAALRRTWRATAGLGAEGGSLAARIALGRDAGFYLDALDALARAGLAKPAWRTPMAHADAVRAARPVAGDAFAAVVERLYAVRFAGLRPTRAQRTGDAELVRRLRSALAHG